MPKINIPEDTEKMLKAMLKLQEFEDWDFSYEDTIDGLADLILTTQIQELISDFYEEFTEFYNEEESKGDTRND